MGVKEKNKSLLEIAIDLFHEKHKLGIRQPQPIMQIAKEVMEAKGLKTAAGKELLPQFLADFMESGYFVYCGDGKWDLKEYQSLRNEKDLNYNYSSSEDAEVQKYELGYEESNNNVSNLESTKLDSNEDEEDAEAQDEIEEYLGEEEEETPIENSYSSLDDEAINAGEAGVETGYEEDEGEED